METNHQGVVMNQFFENLKREAEANPTLTLGVGAAFLTALGKLIQAHGDSAGSRAYAKQVNWKIRQSRRMK
jgi:hypothetical protein